MIPQHDARGLLPAGVHLVNWGEVVDRFGGNLWRERLMAGLKEALDDLKRAGCRRVYLNGSFVTSKEFPNDFDACWEENGVDPTMLNPALLTFDSGRATQKGRYLGELFPASIIADEEGFSFLDFFQRDREEGEPKGIIAIDLGDLT